MDDRNNQKNEKDGIKSDKQFNPNQITTRNSISIQSEKPKRIQMDIITEKSNESNNNASNNRMNYSISSDITTQYNCSNNSILAYIALDQGQNNKASKIEKPHINIHQQVLSNDDNLKLPSINQNQEFSLEKCLLRRPDDIIANYMKDKLRLIEESYHETQELYEDFLCILGYIDELIEEEEEEISLYKSKSAYFEQLSSYVSEFVLSHFDLFEQEQLQSQLSTYSQIDRVYFPSQYSSEISQINNHPQNHHHRHHNQQGKLLPQSSTDLNDESQIMPIPHQSLEHNQEPQRQGQELLTQGQGNDYLGIEELVKNDHHQKVQLKKKSAKKTNQNGLINNDSQPSQIQQNFSFNISDEMAQISQNPNQIYNNGCDENYNPDISQFDFAEGFDLNDPNVLALLQQLLKNQEQ